MRYLQTAAPYPRRDYTDLEVSNYCMPQGSYADSAAFLGKKNDSEPQYIYSVDDSTLRIIRAPYVLQGSTLRIV